MPPFPEFVGEIMIHRNAPEGGQPSPSPEPVSPYSAENLKQVPISAETSKALNDLANKYGVDPSRLEHLYKQQYVFMNILKDKGAKVDISDSLILKDLEIGLKQGPIGPRS
jgi:hypothetical protein